MCDTAQIMKEEYIRAGCNLSVAIIILGIFLCTIAETRAGAVTAFVVMAVGITCGIVFGHAWEKIKPIPWKGEEKPMWEKQDQQDLKDGKFNYIYHPEYPFFAYLSDNDTTLRELISIIDSDQEPAERFRAMYENYCASARGSRVQTVEQIQSMIWRERRRMRNGETEGARFRPKGNHI